MDTTRCGSQRRSVVPLVKLGALAIALLIILAFMFQQGHPEPATAAETDCTVYASPDVSTGSGNSGTTLDAPVSLRDAHPHGYIYGHADRNAHSGGDTNRHGDQHAHADEHSYAYHGAH